MNSSAIKPRLEVAFCSSKASRYACDRWHYADSMPLGRMVQLGVWEDGTFVGAVLFSHGANNRMAKPYGLARSECVELVRVALNKHATPVSRILRFAIKLLRRKCPGLRLIVSYADPMQGHHGGIYQAGGWLYTGDTLSDVQYFYRGRWAHSRTLTGVNFGKHQPVDKAKLRKRRTLPKHRYLMPLDKEMRHRLVPMSKPYPKKTSAPESSTRHGSPVEVGGATPTSALQLQACD